jgi:excinuclease ABC subunit B
MSKFNLVSKFKPQGDQIDAIDKLTSWIDNENKHQTLLGVTGSGKTFSMANVIQKVQKPTLVLAHNKILAAQLCSEFKEFFPNNLVEYFVSYYDYYQPEAYVPQSDLYIEKSATINDEIDELRHSATTALFDRQDVIIVSSVSCIYGLGDPEDYKKLSLSIRTGMNKDRDEIIKRLVEIQYTRNDIDFHRSTFRVRGDVLEIFPSSSSEKAIRVEFFGDEVERISEINPVNGKTLGVKQHAFIMPASHYVTTKDKLNAAITNIEEEMQSVAKAFRNENKLIEEQRVTQKVNYDIEMMREVGFCQGIENYSRHISGREAGSCPFTLIDFFPKDFLLIIDESHTTVPQVRAMYEGDRARKKNLVDYGFRLPSAYDNRPLKFNEFEGKINQVLYVSATPGPYEFEHSKDKIAEQIIRPTGLIDPEITLRPVENQIDDLINEINNVVNKSGRILVTTLTKRMSEDLTAYLKEVGIRVRYLHSEIETIERMKIIRDLRLGEFDVLVGINLLREGLDIPEVSLVAILDADKEGFLRSERSLIQTIGRAARNSEGRVIMYCDNITRSMDTAIKETNRRRKIQMEYNEKNGITPQTIIKPVRDIIESTKVAEAADEYKLKIKKPKNKKELLELLSNMEKDMKEAAKQLQFEIAAQIRDEISKIKKEMKNEDKNIL